MQRKYELIIELVFCFLLFTVCFLNIYQGFHTSGDAYGYFRGAMSYYENGYYSNWGQQNSVNLKNPFGYSLFLSYFMAILGVKYALSFMTILNSILYSFTAYLFYKVLRNNMKEDSRFGFLLSIFFTLSIVLNLEFLVSYFSLYSEVLFLPLFILFLYLVDSEKNSFYIFLITLVLISIRWAGAFFIFSYLLLLLYKKRYKEFGYYIVGYLIYVSLGAFFLSFRSFGEHNLSSIVDYRFQDGLFSSFLDSLQRYIVPIPFEVSNASGLLLISSLALILICCLFYKLRLVKNYYFFTALIYVLSISFVHYFIDGEVTFRNRIFVLLVILFAFILSKKLTYNFYTKLFFLYLITIVSFRLISLYSLTITNFNNKEILSYRSYENSKILNYALSTFDRFELVANDRAPYFFLYPERLLRVDSKNLEQIEPLNESFASHNNELHMLYFHKDLKLNQDDRSRPISISILSEVFNFDYEIIDEEPYLALLKIKRNVSI